MYMRQNSIRNISNILNNVNLCLGSELNDVVNTFIVLDNVKYLENCLDNMNRFLARRVWCCAAPVLQSMIKIIWFVLDLFSFEDS